MKNIQERMSKNLGITEEYLNRKSTVLLTHVFEINATMVWSALTLLVALWAAGETPSAIKMVALMILAVMNIFYCIISSGLYSSYKKLSPTQCQEVVRMEEGINECKAYRDKVLAIPRSLRVMDLMIMDELESLEIAKSMVVMEEKINSEIVLFSGAR